MTLTLALLALGCTPTEPVAPHIPGFEDINFAVDGHIDLLNRVDALAGSQEESLGGSLLDLNTASNMFLVKLSSDEIQAMDDPLDPTEPTYSNVVAGGAGALSVDLTLASRLGSMNTALEAFQDAAINPNTEWAWSGTKAVTNDQGVTVTAQLNLAWVGTGWLVEMLQSTEDGTYDHDLWFNGYYQADGALGWWDFYRTGGVLVTMEYIGARGDGDAELYWPTGENQDDTMAYTWSPAGGATVEWDATVPPPQERELTGTWVDDDQSGMAVIPGYNSSATVCWGADLKNVDCPTKK